MAEEEKKSRPRWTVEELMVLLTYVQELAPNEKVSYVELSDLLAEEGHERTNHQVQKKFDRLRSEARVQNIDVETRLRDLITSMYGEDDGPVERVKSPKPTTPKPKPKQDEEDVTETISGKRTRWDLHEHQVLLECLIAGQDKASEIVDKFPAKEPGKVNQKLHNVKNKAREKNITPVELVRQQINRLRGEIEDEQEESSEEEKTPAKKGTKRKLEENVTEDRSAKKQRVLESPKPTASHTNHNGVTPDNTEIKKLLNQMASNSRENFNNLRKYIDGKLEEKRLQDAEQTAEIKRRMKNMEDNMDLMLREIRSLKSIVTNNTPSKSHVSAPTAHTSNKEFNSNNNGGQSSDSSPSKQISYFNFL